MFWGTNNAIGVHLPLYGLVLYLQKEKALKHSRMVSLGRRRSRTRPPPSPRSTHRSQQPMPQRRSQLLASPVPSRGRGRGNNSSPRPGLAACQRPQGPSKCHQHRYPRQPNQYVIWLVGVSPLAGGGGGGGGCY